MFFYLTVLQIAICSLQSVMSAARGCEVWAWLDSGSYEALRQDSVPARGGRSASRPGARDDAGRGRACNPRGDARGRWDECRVESELSFADRERNAAAPDQHDTAPAGEVFQGASWLSRRRSGGISRGAAER